MKSQFTVSIGPDQHQLTVEPLAEGLFRVASGERTLEVNVLRLGRGEYHLLHDGWGHDIIVEQRASQLVVHRDGSSITMSLLDEREEARLAATGSSVRRSADGSMALRAPMPGKVVKALVKPGEAVNAGQGIIVIEAMKMENELRTTVDGTISEIRVAEGDNVEAGETLVVIG
jgi:biotin carboxyl carrier protein